MVGKVTPEVVPVALAILKGPALEFEWANEYMLEMLERFTDRSILGHPAAEFLTIDSSVEIERAVNHTFDTGEPSHLSIRVVGPDGVMRVRSSAYLIPGNRLLVVALHPVLEPIAPVGDQTVGTFSSDA